MGSFAFGSLLLCHWKLWVHSIHFLGHTECLDQQWNRPEHNSEYAKIVHITIMATNASVLFHCSDCKILFATEGRISRNLQTLSRYRIFDFLLTSRKLRRKLSHQNPHWSGEKFWKDMILTKSIQHYFGFFILQTLQIGQKSYSRNTGCWFFHPKWNWSVKQFLSRCQLIYRKSDYFIFF